MSAKLLAGAVLVAALVLSAYLSQLVQGPSENHPWVVTIVLLCVAAVAGVVWLVLPGGGWQAAWATAAVFLLGGCGFGLVAGWDARDNYLTPYCEYGAKSQAQIDRCLSDVNTEDVDELDTPAARFARDAAAGP
jgi:hypothetical protein